MNSNGQASTGGLSNGGTVSGSLDITGTLDVNGDATFNNFTAVNGSVTGTFEVGTLISDLEVTDPLIVVGKSNPSDILNLGLLEEWNDGVAKYSGIVRSKGDKKQYILEGAFPIPQTIDDIEILPRGELVANSVEANNVLVDNKLIVRDTVGTENWSIRDESGSLIFKDELNDEDFFIFKSKQFQRFRYGGSIGGNIMLVNRANGTQLIPAAIGSGVRIEEIYHRGYDGTGFAVGVLLITETTEAWSPGNHGCLYRIATTDNGSTSFSTKLEIDTDGARLYNDLKVLNNLKVGNHNVNDNSAALQVDSVDKGFLMPRMTEVQRDLITPAEGLEIYNTTSKEIEYYNGTEWILPTQSGVDGPVSSSDDEICLYSGTSGGLIKNSGEFLINYTKNPLTESAVSALGPRFDFQKDRGAGGVISGDVLGDLRYIGKDDVGIYQFGCGIRANAQETFTSSSRGAHLNFRSTPQGSSTPILNMTCAGDNVRFNSPLRASAGDATNPSYSFTSYFNTGMYATPTELNTSVNGTIRSSISATDTLLLTDRVRIGASPVTAWNLTTGQGNEGDYLTSDGAGSSSWTSRSYGSLSMENNAIVTVITTQGVYVPILGVRAFSVLKDFDDSLNNLQYTGVQTKLFKVSSSFTWEHGGGTNENFAVSIFKNGVRVGGTRITSQLDDNNTYPRSASTNGIVELATNDVIDIYTTCLTDTDNVLFVDFNMVITEV